MLAVSFTLTELTVRLVTETAPNGIKKFWNVTLLPLRPGETQVRHALDEFSRDALLMRDPDIGWSVRPNRKNETNAQGIRTSPDHVYRADPPNGKIRIVTLGDSYVYCLQVDNGETWQDYLEKMRGDVEMVNLGLPGGGTDQAFLRWKRDGRRFKSHIVILGIWPDNIFRNLTVLDYYRTQASFAMTKPRLVLGEAGASTFVNSPIMSDAELIVTLAYPEGAPLLKYEYWYDPEETKLKVYRNVRLFQLVESVWRRYQRKLTYARLYSGELADGLDVTLAIAKQFTHEVRNAGSIPLVVLIPDRQRLGAHVGEKPFPLVERLRGAGIDVIDMGPTFGSEIMKEGPDKYYVDGVGHHSPFGNRVFARYLEKELHPWIREAQGLSEGVERGNEVPRESE